MSSKTEVDVNDGLLGGMLHSVFSDANNDVGLLSVPENLEQYLASLDGRTKQVAKAFINLKSLQIASSKLTSYQDSLGKYIDSYCDPNATFNAFDDHRNLVGINLHAHNRNNITEAELRGFREQLGEDIEQLGQPLYDLLNDLVEDEINKQKRTIEGSAIRIPESDQPALG